MTFYDYRIVVYISASLLYTCLFRFSAKGSFFFYQYHLCPARMNQWPWENESGLTQVTFFNSRPWSYVPCTAYQPYPTYNRHRNTKLTPNLRGKISTEHELKLFCNETVACHDLISLIYRSIYLIAIIGWICIGNIMTEWSWDLGTNRAVWHHSPCYSSTIYRGWGNRNYDRHLPMGG